MNIGSNIRAMTRADAEEIVEMMRVFYASPALYTNGSEEIFASDVEACVSDNPFLEGYVVTDGEKIQGYAMLAKSFSTEFGKPCVWIEDLYIKEEYRGTGLGRAFMDFITESYTDCIFRLEVEEENQRAVRLYEKSGFSVLPYLEMKK